MPDSISSSEHTRLAVLESLGVLDTPAEQRFDRFTRLATMTFSVPIALVSLVDEKRQWFKSRCGLDLAETPRSIAFCSHAVELGEMLVIEDAAADSRFAGNPLVTGAPHIRFYAGQPLFSDGHAVGTLCIIDRAPRGFSEEQRHCLRDLAVLVETELHHARVAAARLMAEQALKALNAELEQRIAERIRTQQQLEEKQALLDAELETIDVNAAREQLELSERRLRAIADNVPVLISHLDSERRYVFANVVHQSWLGKTPEQMLGKTMEETFGAEYLAPQAQALEQAWRGQASQCEHEIVRKKHTRIVHTTFLPQLDDGAVVGVYALTTDATTSRLHERSLHALAHSDTLTGLPNRRQFEAALRESALRSAADRAPRPGRGTALLYLDIDHFKQINDRHGHAAGDAVLVEFARRLGASVRSSDLVSRLAGNEFTVLLNDVGGEADLELVARKILASMQAPFALDSCTLQVGTSIGAALADGREIAPAMLTDAAGRALHAARQAGRNTFAMVLLGRAQAQLPARSPALAHG